MNGMNQDKRPLLPANILSGEYPFFIFLSLVLIGITAASIASSEYLRGNPALLGLYSLVMLVHIAIYWLAPRFAASQKQTLLYLPVQYLIAFAAVLISRSNVLTIGVFMGLIGITVGMLRLTRLGVLGIGIILGLSLVSYGMLQGWDTLLQWVTLSVPVTIFISLYVYLYMRQVEERERAQELARELETANRHLAEYAAQVQDLTLANERQRIARELHDTLSQGLAGVILKLEAADAHLGSGRTERARAILEQTRQQARATLSDARRAIDDLRLGAYSASLADGLRQETRRFSEATALPCSLELDLQETVDAALNEPVLRMVSEALSNVARHARASRVSVRLTSRGGCLEAWIEDDGAGFDPGEASDLDGHYGLLGMRERARLAGGSLEIASRPGAGATVHLTLPLAGPGMVRV